MNELFGNIGGEYFASAGAYGDVLKALQASGQGGTDGAPMIPQDLESEAYSTLWLEDHLRLLKQVPSVPGKAIQHEFTRISGYGSLENDGFIRDGGTPISQEFTSERAFEHIRPISEGHEVTGLMAAVNTLNAFGQRDIIAIQRTTKLLSLLRKITKATYFANTLDFSSSTTCKFRGIDQILAEDADAQNTIDLKGNAFSQNSFDDAGQIITDAFGSMTHVNMSTAAIKNWLKTVENVRPIYNIGKDYDMGTIGLNARVVNHAYGKTELFGDIFLNSRYSRYKTPPVYNSTTTPKPTNAPATPANGDLTSAVDAPTVAGSMFDANEIADFGTYYYAVTADNTHSVATDFTGESDPIIKKTAAAYTVPTAHVVSVGGSVTITITTASDAKSYKVYRAVADPTNLASYQFIGEIRNTGASINFVDLNVVRSHSLSTDDVISPTTVAFGFTLPTFRDASKANLQMKMFYPENMPDAVKRIILAPIFPRQQAISGDLAAKELLLSYCAVEIPTPNKCVRFINVGNRNIAAAS